MIREVLNSSVPDPVPTMKKILVFPKGAQMFRPLLNALQAFFTSPVAASMILNPSEVAATACRLSEV